MAGLVGGAAGVTAGSFRASFSLILTFAPVGDMVQLNWFSMFVASCRSARIPCVMALTSRVASAGGCPAHRSGLVTSGKLNVPKDVEVVDVHISHTLQLLCR